MKGPRGRRKRGGGGGGGGGGPGAPSWAESRMECQEWTDKAIKQPKVILITSK